MRSMAQRFTASGAHEASSARVVVPVLLLAIAACATSAGSRGAPAQAGAAAQAPSPAGASRPGAPTGERRVLSPRSQRLFDEAVAAADEQKRLKVPVDWEILERRWRAVTEVEPVPEAYFNLGVALEHRGRLDEARAAYRRAIELDPDLAPAVVNLALLDEPKDPHQAAQAWADVVRRFPEEPAPHVRLAALYEAAGQSDEAWRLAREALIRDPRAVGAYKVMMRVALDRDRLDLAQLLVVKARKLDPSDPGIVSFAGDVFLRQKDDASAVAQWRKAVAMQGDYLPARYALLADELGKQHWQGVAEQAGAILRTNPSDARVHLVLGIADRYLGKPDEALAAYGDAERLGSGRLPEVHLARGVALMKTKEQCEPALAELKRYLLAVGPAAASDGPAPRLERECEQILAANRQAEEASREMKAQAEREAARGASSAPPAKPAAADPGEAQAVPHAAGAIPSDKSDKVRSVPTT